MKTGFLKWITENNWYETAPAEWDKFDDPNACFRLTLQELYAIYKGDKIEFLELVTSPELKEFLEKLRTDQHHESKVLHKGRME